MVNIQNTPRVSLIAAIGKNGELGKSNELIWRISADLKRVKSLTTGHPIIMGRKTYESIGRPLPNRTNIVISNTVTEITGCLVFKTLAEGLKAAKETDETEIFIFGGAQIYKEALPDTDRLYLTVIEAVDSEADVHFPDYSEFSNVLESEAGNQENLDYTWQTLERPISS